MVSLRKYKIPLRVQYIAPSSQIPDRINSVMGAVLVSVLVLVIYPNAAIVINTLVIFVDVSILHVFWMESWELCLLDTLAHH